MNPPKNINNSLLMFAGGALTGYATSALLKFGKKNGKAIDWDALSEKLFGISTQEAVDKLRETVEPFQENISNLMRKLNEFDDKKYKQLVDQFGKRLEEDKSFTKDQIGKLTDYLTKDYKKMLKASTN